MSCLPVNLAAIAAKFLARPLFAADHLPPGGTTLFPSPRGWRGVDDDETSASRALVHRPGLRPRLLGGHLGQQHLRPRLPHLARRRTARHQPGRLGQQGAHLGQDRDLGLVLVGQVNRLLEGIIEAEDDVAEVAVIGLADIVIGSIRGLVEG